MSGDNPSLMQTDKLITELIAEAVKKGKALAHDDPFDGDQLEALEAELRQRTPSIPDRLD